MPVPENVKFYLRAMTHDGELLVRGEGDPDLLRRGTAPMCGESGVVRTDCCIFIWYEKAGDSYELLALSAKGPKEFYHPSHNIVLDLIRGRQTSARLSSIEILRGWPAEQSLAEKLVTA